MTFQLRRQNRLTPKLILTVKSMFLRAALSSVVLVALVVCFQPLACGQTQPVHPSIAPAPVAITNPPTTSGSASESEALTLDSGDLIDVRVFDTPELSERLRVDHLGEIVLPVGGAVSVRGLTAEQAQTAIEGRLRQQKILRNPHVEVFVLEYATQGVTVAGEVKTPGVYPWIAKHTVLDFVSIAGGLTPAASKTVTISRKDREQVITFQLSGSAQESGADPEVRPGDRIFITRAGVVYVVGDVGRPGGYLIESKQTVTVLQAIALAQGMNKTAKYDAKLIRNSPAGRTESDLPLKRILANTVPDPKLQDGDILFIPVNGGKEWAEKGVTSVLQMAVGVVIYGRL